MPRFRFAVTVLAVAAILAVTSPAASQNPPAAEIVDVANVPAPDTVVWTMRASLGIATLPVAFYACRAEGDIETEIHFGSLPRDRRPIQLAVRRPDGTVERFGPVFAARSWGGPHTSRIVHRGDAERFANAALRTGSSISNGYEIYRNVASEADNRAAREAIVACLSR